MLVGELADVLEQFRDLQCAPSVECEDGAVTLTVSLPSQTLDNLNLFNELRRATDVHQMRAIADRYGIDPQRVEALMETDKEGS